MAKLISTIPDWVAEYIGIPFKPGGRCRAGVDCYGLVRLVYAERLGVHLPILTERYHDLKDRDVLARTLQEELSAEGPGWMPFCLGLEEADVGDVLTFRLGRCQPHVGIMVAQGRMLHSIEGCDSAHESFDDPIWRSRLTGTYRFGGPVLVRGATTPFASSRIDCTVPTGPTLGEIVAIALAGSKGHLERLRVYIGNSLVPREAWDRVRPRAGRLVTIAAVPMGGGGNGGKTVLRLVATIAIIAAAAWAGPALVSAGVSKVGAALIVGAGTIGLGLALSALAPPPKPRLSAGDSRNSPTISGARNDARLFQPVPQVMGTHRLVPPLAARVYTEAVGDDQYLRMLCAWYGPCEISDIQIGDTSIDDYDGVEIEVRSGYLTDEPIRLYPNTVIEEPLSVLIEQSANWIVRTTATAADEISLDLLFPSGLARVTSSGDREEFTVDVDVEYAPAGSGAWQRVNGDGGIIGSPADARGMDLLFRTPEVTFGGQEVSTSRIGWGLGFPDSKPGGLPATGFSWSAEGWFRDPSAPENGGTYYFSIDSSDACDLEIDGRIVASFYGTHEPVDGSAAAPNFAAHQSEAVFLYRGYHRVRVRMEARSTTGAVAVAWKRPSAPSTWEIIPGNMFRRQAGGDSEHGLLRRWYTTTTYRSVISTTAARTDQIRPSLSWAVPTGQYDVRVRRVTADSADDHLLDDVYWSALRTIRNQDPVRLPGMAKIALRIRATDRLNGVIDNLSCLVRSIYQDYDAESNSWIERATSNPASCYRAVLQGRANKRPLADSRLTQPPFTAWHADCAAKGLEFNAVLDFPGTVFERLADIASAGRASPGLLNGQYTVVQDKPQSVPVQLITPRNSFGFRGRKVYPRVPHGLRVQNLERNSDYQRAERIVLADGYQLDDLDAWGIAAPGLPAATELESIELFGCTSAEQAFKHGRYHLAVAILRPETYELSMDWEHLAATRGDMVLVNHDVPKIGDAYGRVVRLIVDSDDVLHGIEIDNALTMDAGQTYLVRVRLDDGRVATWYLQNAGGGTSTVLTFVSPAGPSTPRPSLGDLCAVGREGLATREMIIKAIEPNPDLSARLTLIDHAPAVHLADVGTIPDFDPGITRDPVWRDGPEDPVIEQLRSDDWVMIRDADGSLRPRIVVYLRRPVAGTRPMPTHIQVRYRPFHPSGSVGPWVWTPLQPVDPSQVSIENVIIGEQYRIEIRYLTAVGQTSRWVGVTHTVVGNVLPPPDVQAFDVQALSDGTRRYSWDLGTIPPDIAGVLLRYQPSTLAENWASMTPLHTGVLDPASPHELNAPGSGTWRFGIKMVDTAGNESTNALFVVRTLGMARQPGSVLTANAQALGWPGTKTNCRVMPAGPVLEAIDSSTWDTLASIHNILTWNAWGGARWNLAPASPITYEHPPIDLGGIVTVTPSVLYGYAGLPLLEIRWSTDGSNYTNWVDFNTILGNALTARYLHWRLRVAADPSGGFYVPTITDMLMEALAEPVSQVLDNVSTSALVAPYRLGVGDVRLPVDGRFHVIRSLNLAFNGMGAGYSYVVVDKNISPGPRVQIFNELHQPADAVIDAAVDGF